MAVLSKLWNIGFEAFTALWVFWVVSLQSLLVVYQCSSKTLFYSQKATQCKQQERHCLKSLQEFYIALGKSL